MAGYRKAYDQRGRAWLAVDGTEVAMFCDSRFENAWRDAGRAEGVRGWPFTDSAHQTIRAQGMVDKVDLLEAMGRCIGHSIEALLAHPDLTVRALAMLDRRLGKRRLAAMDVTGAHPLVARFHSLRCEAETVEAKAR
jgi:hypothetical protein